MQEYELLDCLILHVHSMIQKESRRISGTLHSTVASLLEVFPMVFFSPSKENKFVNCISLQSLCSTSLISSYP